MLLFSSLLSLLALSADPTPRSNLVIAPCDAGEHQQFEVVSCDIELKNIGDKTIRVFKAEPVFAWDSIDSNDVIVPARSTAYIKAKVALRDSAGYTKRSFRFSTDEPGQTLRGSNVTTFVSTVLDDSAPSIDFGVVNLVVALPGKSVALASREVKDFRVLEVLSKPDFLDVAIDSDGRTVRATIRNNAPWGLAYDKIKLKTNAPQQTEAWVTVKANVLGDVVPDGNPFALGLMRNNNKNQFLIRLTHRSGKDFKVGALTFDQVKAKGVAKPCIPKASGCKLIQVDIDNDQQQGRLQGVLHVELPDFGRSLPIELVGMLLNPEVKVHDLNEEIQQSREAKSGAQSAAGVEPPKGIDIKQVIKQTVDKQAEILPAGNGPLLRWSAANQNAIYGYAVYRGDAETGPFLRVNKDVIRVVSNDDTKSGTYAWRDNSAESGKAYWYYVGMINKDGSKKELTGPQKVVAK